MFANVGMYESAETDMAAAVSSILRGNVVCEKDSVTWAEGPMMTRGR